MEKVLSNILLRIISLGLSYWFYRGHLEQYVHYIAHYGPYFQVFLNLVIIILLGYFVYAFLKLLLTRKKTMIGKNFQILNLQLIHNDSFLEKSAQSGFFLYSMKIKVQTKKLAADCSKHCFEVADGS